MTDTAVVLFPEGAAPPAAMIGGKAFWLWNAHAAGLPVPRFFCIPVTVLDECLCRTGLQGRVEALLDEMRQRPIRRGQCLQEIRELIGSMPIPADIADELHAGATRLGYEQGLAVRSSVPGEDSFRASHAGVFHSEGPIHTRAQLMAAVTRCFQSLYTDGAHFYREQHGTPAAMGIVIQAWVDADWSAVLFTEPPWGDPGHRLMEVVRGGCRSLVDGGTPDARLLLPRHGRPATDHPDFLSESALGFVQYLAERVETLVGAPADLELAARGESVALLQCRPITTRRERAPVPFAVIPLEDIEQCLTVDMGKLQPLFVRWLQKKVWFRRILPEYGLQAIRVFYVAFTPQGIRQASAGTLLEHLRSNWVLVEYGENDPRKYLPVSGLWEELLRLADGVPDHQQIVVRIREEAANELSGWSGLTKAGDVVIEYTHGEFTPMAAGKVPPSTVVLDAENAVVRHTFSPAPVLLLLDDATGIWEERTSGEQLLPLSAEAAREIARATRAMADRFGEARLEWFYWMGELFIKDVTVERSSIHAPHLSQWVMAPGSARGRVVRLESWDDLDPLVMEYGISVVASNKQGAVLKDQRMQRVLALLEGGGEDVILVAPRPATALLPLVERVRGFVFEQGALLSHLAIVLRETGKPAFVDPVAYRDLRDGDLVTLSAGMVLRE